jgi:hypothetical protein
MKTALISALIATLLGVVSFASGRHFDAADFTAIVFTTGLVAWTVGQYSRQPRSLTRAQICRLPAPLPAPAEKEADVRLAA